MRIISSNKFAAYVFLFSAVCPALFAAEIQTNQLHIFANEKINFDRDIRPIFEASCRRCHGAEKPKSHFRLDNREAALKGGNENTNDIVPGDCAKSLLINYVAREVPDMEMPPVDRGEPLTQQQIGRLRAWINQGASWSTTNSLPQLAFAFAPTIRFIDVQGDQSKFRELEGVNDGFSGGIENFSIAEQISPDEKMSLAGHVIIPNQDVDLKLALDKTDLGFVHAGFEEWRKYYSDNGGYDPTVIPSEFNLDRDLHVDNGRVWIDFGLALPERPQIVLGYEYQFKNGTKSMLDWGDANGANIYPATQVVDEQTHIIKLEVMHDFDDWHLEDNARVEFYSEKNQSFEPQIFVGGTTPDASINTQDDYHSVQGMNTLMLEKQIRDWWFLSGGFYYSRLEGSDFFNQTTAIPAFNFSSVLSSQQITLRRESEIFSLASLFKPLAYLTLSLGSQNEWTREKGFGSSVPDFDLGVNTPAGSSQEKFKSSQNANLRFTKIPFTVLFADARFDQESINEFQQENPDEFTRQTDSFNNRYHFEAGLNTSPWRWVSLNAQYQRQSSDTDYNNLDDVFDGISGVTNGYPAFILDRKIQMDGFETKLVLRPANWLKTALTYQISDTDYSSKTDPAFNFNLQQAVSPGGAILDGCYDAQIYGFSATITPIQKLYFTGAFTYSQSRAVTSDNGDPAIVPYRGNIYTLNVSAAYALNVKTSLQTSYVFSRANYGENNGASVPLGLDFTRHELLVGLTRQITKRLTGALHYEFSQYTEPGGGFNNFTAHGIFATLAYRWP